MERKRLNKLLSHIVDLKPGEEKLVALLFVCFFLIACPHTIVKALRYADLLWRLGTGGLPIAYFSAAVASGLFVILHSRLHHRVSTQLMITASLIFFIITGILLHFLLLTDYGRDSRNLSYFFWVWASVLTIVLITQFWSIINETFNLREARRLIGFCGSGGILGGIAGGLIAKFLTNANLAHLLLPLACAMLFACIFVVRAVFVVPQKKLLSAKPPPAKKEQPDTSKTGFLGTFHAVRKEKYLVLISGLVIMTVIVSTLVDFQFSSVVDDIYYSKEAKQAFFGLFYAGMLTVSFFFSLFLTGKILENSRRWIPLLLTPVALIFCSLGILFLPLTLLPTFFIKGSDEGLGFSLHQPVREILYVPLASNLKVKVKPFIDMFISRFAKVLAAFLLLIFALTLNKEIEFMTPNLDIDFSKDLVYVVMAFLILWVIISLEVGKEYNRIIREKIEIVWPDAHTEIKKLDINLAKLVFDTIESKNHSSVLYAMHLFDLVEKGKLTPDIKKIIAQKTSEVKVSSLGDLLGADGATSFPEIDDDDEREKLIADIRDIVSSDAYRQVIKLLAAGILEKGEGTEINRMEIAKAIGRIKPDVSLMKTLEDLISDDSPQVSCYAIRSAARLKKTEHIPAIMDKLSDPRTRQDAITALEAYGNLAMSSLEEYLSDREKDIPSRRAVVEVLACIASQEAVKVLLRELDRNSEELETEVIDALDRIRSKRKDIHFPGKLAERATLSLIKKYCQTFIEHQNLVHNKKNEELGHRMGWILEIQFRSIFKLLGLYHPHEDIVKASQNLTNGTIDSISDATELLEITLKKKMKDVVLPLVEDLDPSERQQKFRKILRKLDSISLL
jgi:AAA family ATP:ADP antiporter